MIQVRRGESRRRPCWVRPGRPGAERGRPRPVQLPREQVPEGQHLRLPARDEPPRVRPPPGGGGEAVGRGILLRGAPRGSCLRRTGVFLSLVVLVDADLDVGHLPW